MSDKSTEIHDCNGPEIYIHKEVVVAVRCAEKWFASGADLAELSGVKGAKAVLVPGEAPFVAIPAGSVPPWTRALKLCLGEWLVRGQSGELKIFKDAEFRATFELASFDRVA